MKELTTMNEKSGLRHEEEVIYFSKAILNFRVF
jgi:hypothetical protein